MTDETVNIKLFRQKQVFELFEMMEARGEDDSQIVADLFATAVLGAEILGWETSSMFQVISQQQPMATEILERMDGFGND
jgi:hypothetical protein